MIRVIPGGYGVVEDLCVASREAIWAIGVIHPKTAFFGPSKDLNFGVGGTGNFGDENASHSKSKPYQQCWNCYDHDPRIKIRSLASPSSLNLEHLPNNPRWRARVAKNNLSLEIQSVGGFILNYELVDGEGCCDPKEG